MYLHVAFDFLGMAEKPSKARLFHFCFYVPAVTVTNLGSTNVISMYVCNKQHDGYRELVGNWEVQ